MDFSNIFDSYSGKARLQPVLLILFPILLSFAVWTPLFYDWASGLIGLIMSCGVLVFLTHMTREKGHSAEKKLFDEWDGAPTTRFLRHRDDNLDGNTKARYHNFFEDHITGWTTPSLESEEDDPAEADAKYESAVRWLREQEFDPKRFRLIFKENVSYGFRRNLYSMRPLAIGITLGSFLTNVALSLYNINHVGVTELASLTVSSLFLAGFFYVMNKNWVKDSANAYARALLSSCDMSR